MGDLVVNKIIRYLEKPCCKEKWVFLYRYCGQSEDDIRDVSFDIISGNSEREIFEEYIRENATSLFANVFSVVADHYDIDSARFLVSKLGEIDEEDREEGEEFDNFINEYMDKIIFFLKEECSDFRFHCSQI